MYLIPAFLFAFTGLVLLGLRRVWPGFAYHWLVAAAGGLLAWIGALLTRYLLPLPADFLTWPVERIYAPGLVFMWDNLSWMYALALGSIGLAQIVSEVERAPEDDGSRWATGMLIAGLGILSAFAGNFFTFLVLFTAIDLALLLGFWGQASEPTEVFPQVAGPFAARLLGTGFLSGALVLGSANTSTASIVGAAGPEVVLFILGIYLRLGSSFSVAGGEQDRMSAGRELFPAATALILIPRWFLAVPTQESMILYLAVLVILLGSVRALAWAASDSDWERRISWLAAAGALVVLAALRGQIQSSAAWGIGFLLSGGVLTLIKPAQRWLLALPVIAIWGVTGLPLSPTWEGMGLYAPPLSGIFTLGLLVHGLLLGGFFRHAGAEGDAEVPGERWVRVLYPIGLALPLITHQWIAWSPDLVPLAVGRYPWWPGVLAIGIGAVIWWWLQLGKVAETIQSALRAGGVILKNLARPLAGIPIVVRRVTDFLGTIMEGEGGVLWALLFLALIVSILIQFDVVGPLNGN